MACGKLREWIKVVLLCRCDLHTSNCCVRANRIQTIVNHETSTSNESGYDGDSDSDNSSDRKTRRKTTNTPRDEAEPTSERDRDRFEPRSTTPAFEVPPNTMVEEAGSAAAHVYALEKVQAHSAPDLAVAQTVEQLVETVVETSKPLQRSD